MGGETAKTAKTAKTATPPHAPFWRSRCQTPKVPEKVNRSQTRPPPRLVGIALPPLFKRWPRGPDRVSSVERGRLGSERFAREGFCSSRLAGGTPAPHGEVSDRVDRIRDAVR
jgi:hypothetical protein